MAKDTDKRWKGLLQDWPTVAEMDTDDFEYKILNQQQIAILLAALSPYRWRTRWIDLDISKDELEKLISEIELRLMRDERMSPDELKQAIRDGMYTMVNDVAKQIVSGVTSGFSIDDDGNVVIGGGADDPANLPEDDPETPVDELEAAKTGGCIAIKLGIDEMFTTLNTWYGGDATEDMTVANAQFYFKTKYDVDDAKADLAVAEWWEVRSVSGTTPASIGIVNEALYCEGANKQTVMRFIIDNPSSTTLLQTLVADAANESQYATWYNRGIEVPSTDYISYPCTPMPEENLILLINGASGSISTVNTQKTFHRLLFTVSGKVQHPTTSGRYFDFFYENNVGVVTYRGGVNISRLGGGINEPAQDDVPYSASGVYVFSLDITAGGGDVDIDKSLVSGFPTVTTIGQFSIKIQDVGQFTI